MSNQAKLLLDLARKIRKQPKSKAQAIQTLTAAKILTKNGNLTVQYSNLGKAISEDSDV